MPGTDAPSSRRPPRRRLPMLAAGVLAVVALWGPGTGLAAPVGLSPPVLLDPSLSGAELAVSPTVVRADDVLTVDVTLGPDAPDDLWVTVQGRAVMVDDTGSVTPTTQSSTALDLDPAAFRLAPGERGTIRVRVSASDAVAAVVAQAVPADDRTAAVVEVASIVLTGPAGPAPTVALTEDDERAVAVVRSTGPLLLNVTLAGATPTTHTERLVLPDAPLRLESDVAPWPLPTTVAVTDELGRTVTASIDRAPVLAIAAVLLASAVLALAVSARGHRRQRSA